MSLAERMAALSPEQRALLEQMRGQLKAAARPQGPPPIPRVSGPAGAGDWPLSFDQERLWFLALLDPLSTAYNMLTATRLRGDVQVATLEQALGEVLRRQGAWRATFPTVDGAPVQRIASEIRLPLPVIDLAGLPGVDREAAARGLLEEDARRPFALDRGPLVRARLIRLDEREHVCLLTVHHIVSDWVTFQLFWRELAALYEARLAGRPAVLPELPIQYPDFVAWQRGWLQGEVLDRYLGWWMEQLRGFPQVLDLPTDRPRKATQSARGGRLPVRMSRALTQRLRELCRREGLTRFMALTAVWGALFHRLSGQDKVILGTLNANRGRPEVQPLFGFFLTQLPLAVDLAGDPTALELLARVRQTAVAAFAHQELPFGKLVQALQPERDLGRMPLVQALVQVIDTQGGPAAEQRLADLRLEAIEVFDGNARYDLMFALFEGADSISGPLEYDAELFDAATAARMLELFYAMAEAVATHPEFHLSELPAFPAAARHQVLLEWNDTAPAADPLPTVVRMFEAQAVLTPREAAWTGDGWSLTYAELDRRSQGLARYLRRLGAGPETVVGIYLERAADLPVALLGVLRSGAAYLPLDVAHPAERRAFVLDDAGVALVLTRSSLLPGLPEGVRAVCLDPGWEEMEEGAEPLPAPDPESRAYVIYTSGSTGRPKGVEITHRALSNFLHAMRGLYRVGEGDAMPAITTIGFDLSVPEIYLPMLGGGTTPLLTREVAADGTLLARALDGAAATVLQATPVTWRMLLEAGWQGRAELLLLCGAEALSRDLADRLLPLGRGLWNFYGPTETTVWSTAWQVEEGSPISIGRPIRDTRVYLLDRGFAPVPVGAAGELCIGGAGLARGYLGRPELTAQRFIPDPFAGGPGARNGGARLYRTGDLARYRPDGLLEYLGRSDHQVKLRGFRIELGEIEALLRSHPAVSEAVVLLREDRPADPRLAAYLGLVPGGSAPPAAELRDLLKTRLPDYMLPSAFVALPALPRNPNGKVDRKALPAPEKPAVSSGADYVAPRDEAEAEVAAIWERLLGVERVGANDNFFELGGHSLLAHRVLGAVRERLGTEVALRTLFEEPTVAGVASAVTRARRKEAGSEGEAGLPPIERLPRKAGEPSRFPVSFSQLREWILDRIEPGTAAYNIPGGSRATGPLSAPVLSAAIQEIVRRHESLRTVFAATELEPVQVVLPWLELPVPLVDLSALPGASREAEAARVSRATAAEPLDLARGPLLRIRLVRLSAQEHLIVFAMHHIIADGWSLGIFFREMAALYASLSEGRPAPLPALPVQYGDYAAWQRAWMQGEVMERHLSYWKRQLAGAPPLLRLPTDRPRPPVQTYQGARQPFELPAAETAGLRALARDQGASLFVALLAAFQALLLRWSGQDDLAVGTFSGSRRRAELDGLIGFFVNTLVLRGDLAGDPSFRGLVGRLREVALDAHAHGDVPFEQVIDALRLERSLSHTPLFQAMLILQNYPAPSVQPEKVTLAPLSIEDDRANFDLSLWLHEVGGGIAGRLEHNTGLFEPATMIRFGAQLRCLVRSALADPDRRISEIEVMEEAERRQLLCEWSGAGAAPGEAPPVHLAFERRAAEAPDAVALACEAGEWTYRQLDARAGEIAGRLRVGPEEIVGICLERSFDLIASLLAVAKAGGAYLPLDPDYPAERLAAMLDDSGAAVLITREPLFGRLPRTPERAVLLDGAGAGPAELAGAGVDPGVDPDQAVYVLYTSGSTGRPKGVVVRHGSLASYTDAARRAYGLAPGDRVLQFASIGFDTSAEEIYPCLAAGATLVLRTDPRPVDAPEFLATVARLGVTVLDLPTAYWHELVAALERDPRLAFPPSVRLVILGGERALPARVRAWRERCPLVRLVNTYGPTEGTIVATHAELSPASWDFRWDAEVPIGRPVPGARVFLLDRALQPVPAGAYGELCLGGAGLARGYLGRADLTAERFIPSPFGSDRLYRTGDLARFRPDGQLEFGGRVDLQVKVRGVRVEPGEVEAALAAHPALAEAVVAARADGTEGSRLVAWAVPRPGREPTVSELRAFLRERLPEAMVPSSFVTLSALPRLPNGKVDRRALPDPDEGERPSLRSAYAAPETELERAIAAVWRDLLRLDRVGLHDNFFDLGGHSLLLIQAQGRLRETLGREIAAVDLFRFPTVAHLARHLGSQEDRPAFEHVQDLAGRQRSAQSAQLRRKQALEKLQGSRNR